MILDNAYYIKFDLRVITNNFVIIEMFCFKIKRTCFNVYEIFNVYFIINKLSQTFR